MILVENVDFSSYISFKKKIVYKIDERWIITVQKLFI